MKGELLRHLRRVLNILSRYYYPSDDFAAVVTYSVSARSLVLRFFLRQAPIAFFVFRIKALRRIFCDYSTTERIIEVPFVLRNLNLPDGATVLDFGCSESPLSLELANLGYRVTGVDLRPYPFDHPNFRFAQGDIRGGALQPESFDAVVCLSALEHVGLDAYGGTLVEDGDLEIMELLTRCLKPGGRFLLTAPYGKGMLPGSRVYDDVRLERLLERFKVVQEAYYYKAEGKHWILSDRSTVREVLSTVSTQGVALVVAVKG